MPLAARALGSLIELWKETTTCFGTALFIELFVHAYCMFGD